MKLWLLRPIEDLPKGSNPWDPWYDRCFGFVVRAENEQAARAFAAADAGQEARNSLNPWNDPAYSTCVELAADGDAGVVMSDVHQA